ncbi:DUF1428 family protein [Altererythrobacter salegens]|uniref:DUF1428 family protein n=1 Tax=Croceibacterium salegens TaxID=1737568 RepID=A0A6I4SZK4_9SPHN|nr:DUF1428 domain-containing protein [Croceibacterium salegens]MXO60236.1 DUF1428 family protein [Croceibacterium salegens]
MQIDGYVIPVPEGKKQEYLELAQWYDQLMIEHGAIEVFEGWELDVPDGTLTDFRRAVAAEEGEKIVFSWILWPDKATADAAHEAVHEDERFKSMTSFPFDGKRMIVGTFEPIVALRKD